MKKSLLKLIVCPFCNGSFSLTDFIKEKQETMQGKLSCKCCEYPIINGVPRLLPKSFQQELISNHPRFFSEFSLKLKDKQENKSENTKQHKKRLDKEKLTTSKRFSYEWKKFSHLHQEYEQQFLDWVNVPQKFFKDKVVLDAGCGTGRHTYCSAKFAAKTVIGIDLGESVEVAYHNNKDNPNVHIIQADIYNLPFKKNTFDYAYSIGVIHHLPRPEQGFRNILPLIKKKGHVSIWVYGKEGNGLLKIMDPIRKHFISKLPLRVVDLMSLAIIIPLYPIFKIYSLIEHSYLKSLGKFLPQYHFFCYLAKLNFRICHSILFDQFLAPTAFYHTRNEISSWFNKAKLSDIKISRRNNNSWRGFAKVCVE